MINLNMTQKKNQSRLQSEIEANLKRAYDDVLNEAVPERFTQLLEQLRKRNGGNGQSGGSNEQ